METSKFYEKYCAFINQNNRGAQIGIYSVALVGLTVALRRVRPFSTFRSPNDIPKAFYKNRRELTGQVKRIEPNGPLLMVKHKPLVSLPGISQDTLPVKIAGVNVNGHGISWLQTIVVGNEITFVPVVKENKWVECEITIPQIVSKRRIEQMNIGEAIVTIGFGKAEPTKCKNFLHMMYLDKLSFAEDVALRREMGLRYYIKPTKIILMNIMKLFQNLVNIVAQKKQQQSIKSKPKLMVT